MKKLIPFLAALLLSSAAWAENVQYFEGKGEAPIENGDKKQARQNALEAAMRDALTKGAGAIIDSSSIVEGGTLVQDRIYAHAQGYIKKYEVGADGPESDDPGVYQVSLNHVVVSTADISKDMEQIHAALVAKSHPRLYVLVREQSIETLGATSPKQSDKQQIPWAQLSQGVSLERMEQQMTAVGWHFVDPEVASGKVHIQNALTTDLSNLNGRDFSTTGADYVVLGSVVVRPAATEEEAKSVGTPVEIRAVVKIKSTDTGETVASVEYSKIRPGAAGFMANARLALEEAGDELAKTLSGLAVKRWNARQNGVDSVHLLVAVNDYDILRAFEDQLQKGIANIKGVDEVSFNDGKADLSVMMAGSNARQLAGSISAKSVKGMQVKVTKVTEHTVEVKLVR